MQKIQTGVHLTSQLAIATVAQSAYRFGDQVGIAANTVAANMPNEFHSAGVYKVVKPVGEAWADGASIYAVGAAGAAVTFTQTSAAGAIFVGHVHAHVEGEWQASFAGLTYGYVNFNGGSKLV